MDLVAKLPSIEDAGLAVLHENAERLERTGTPAQRSAASALIPAIEAELAARRAAKAAAPKPATKRAAAKPATKRAPAKRAAKAKDRSDA